MPLILSNHEEAPGLQKKWLDEYNDIVPDADDITLEFFGKARFARLVTDNVRALAAYQCELAEIQKTVNGAIMVRDGESSPVEHARLTLLQLYLQNLKQWRYAATRALRQWRFANEHGPDTKDPYFEPPKDGWQERNNIERALNELDSCTDRLPAGWGGGPFGQEEVEVVFDEEEAQVENGMAEGGEAAAAGSEGEEPGLVDYSDTDSDSEEESEDDFVLTVNGQPTYNGQPIAGYLAEGYRIGDVFPGGEAEEEEAESEMDGSDDSDELPDQFDSISQAILAQTAWMLEEWEAANRDTTGDFIDGRFVP